MKINDDYKAKLELWARQQVVVRMPHAVGIPHFRSRRFSSAAEMNQWKKELLKEIALNGGVQWIN